MTRRELMALAAAPLAAQKLAVRPGCQTNAWRVDPNDFQSLMATLERIRHYQYQGFETGYRNLRDQFSKPKHARTAFEKTGMKFIGVHIFLFDYDPVSGIAPWSLIEEVCQGTGPMGAERLILSGRGMTVNGKVDTDDVKRKAGALERASRIASASGLKLAYHNHDVEFSGGGAEIDLLLERTDKDAVSFLIDAGHAHRGGADVAGFLAKHHKRVAGLHLRDFKGGEQVPLGAGEFDLAPLAKAIGKSGWRGWVINEEERLNDVRPGDAAVEPARAHVRRIFGV